MATFVAGVTGVDFDLLDLGPLALATPAGATGTSLELRANGVITQIYGRRLVNSSPLQIVKAHRFARHK